MRIRILLLCLLGSTLALAAPGHALAQGTDGQCKKVGAVGVGENHDGNTTATFFGDPLLQGTATGHIAIVGGAPPVLDMTTDIVFATRFGTFRADTTGTFNVETSRFTSTGPVSAGTEGYQGATGSLTFDGLADLETGRFAEAARGQLCLTRQVNDQNSGG